jgi:hypothetical protein
MQRCSVFDAILKDVVQIVYLFPRGVAHSPKHFLQTTLKK